MNNGLYMPKTHTQPCWYCTKACGGCSWSKDFTPIKNWVAEKVIVDRYIYEDNKETIIESYKILHCPELVDERIEYLKQHLHLRPWEIATELHCSINKAKILWRQVHNELKENEKSI